jgi:hypothetical protein
MRLFWSLPANAARVDAHAGRLHDQAMQRVLALLVALMLAPAARAQSPAVDDYFAAVDRGEAELTQKYGPCANPKPGVKMEDYDAEAERLNRGLDPLMRLAVGRISLPRPFFGDGNLNPGLGCGLGTDALDGIRFWTGSGDNWSGLLVTTSDLLRRWLKKNEPDRPQLQADLDAAFRTSQLTTEVIDREAWREVFATLPIDKPTGVDAAFAFLGQSGNGSLIWPPTMISVYLRKRDRIFLADLSLAIKFTPIEACGDPNKPAWSEENLARFNQCWKERGAAEPAVVAATRQAQAFINALAAE